MAKRTAPPTDTFMAMLDLAWDDFRTYREKGDDSRPLGLAIVLIGDDSQGHMTIKTGSNLHPEYVQAALASLVMGFATGAMQMEQMPGIKRKRVV